MEICLVGGAVRDQLLGLAVKDRDWVVVGATPEELIAQGYRPVGRDFPVFLHPQNAEEYALARTERKSGKGYLGFECYAAPDVTLEEDLARRDLTINAMAQRANGELVDPYGGQADLAARCLRHVSPAFAEDPLRVLRVARFASRFAPLGFQVAEETLALMQEISLSGELRHLTPERVWQEWERSLASRHCWVFLQVLEAALALEDLLPELLPLPLTQIQTGLQHLGDTASAEQRFTLILFFALSKSEKLERLDALCQRLRIPNRFRDQASAFCSQARSLYQFSQLDACARLHTLKQLKLLKHPKYLSNWMSLLHACFQDVAPHLADRLDALLQALSRIDPQTFIQKGIQGQALGQALEAEQLRLCAHF
ncbi:hypothetical protein [Nitrincola tapanii]|uniref:CCA tRNA nucleotidyltransferase n=1 Tax=Nitrincola tapanii TaxID=1708751 RepID=A0A5A9VYL0_9GAMM|nr:hypothetical protein [Nitrincola tapanii]KAA0873556.1 hypothetical protein E1H14_12820 [Nitrincola tapanii]